MLATRLRVLNPFRRSSPAEPRPADQAIPTARGTGSPTDPDALAPAFVWGVWLVMAVLAVRLVVKFGSPLPFDDEWEYLWHLGSGPVTLEWLFSFHNEHRIPLPRLVYLAAIHATNIDFRAPQVVSAVALAVAAGILVAAAGKLRGKLWWTDAFIPVVFLNFAHADNLLWGFQLPFALGTLFGCCVLYLAATSPSGPGGWRLAAVVGLAAVLPLCGANGVAFVPAIAVWLGWLGVRRGLDVGSVRAALPGLAGAVVAGCSVVAYFVGYVKPAHHAGAGSPGDVATAFVQVVAIGAGNAVAVGGGAVPRLWGPVGGGVLVLGLAAGIALLIRAWHGDRRAMSLAFVAGGFLSLAAGVAVGRSGLGPDAALTPRYVLLGVPLLAWVYLAWTATGLPVGRVAQVVMFVAAVGLLWANTTLGLNLANLRRAGMTTAVAEVRGGVPGQFAADRVIAVAAYPGWIATGSPQAQIGRLQRENVGVFGKLAPPKVFAEREIAATLSANGGRLDGGVLTSTLPNGELVLKLPAAVRAKGVRWEYELSTPNGYRPEMHLTWAVAGVPGKRGVLYPLHCTGAATTSHVWIDDTVDELRLRFDTLGTRFQHGRLIVLTE